MASENPDCRVTIRFDTTCPHCATFLQMARPFDAARVHYACPRCHGLFMTHPFETVRKPPYWPAEAVQPAQEKTDGE
jgi:uncharacterized CHY-type Zn-finger protein